MRGNDQDYKDKNCSFSIDYWKCPCGKINSNHSEICVKCGKERPVLCRLERICY